MPGVFPDYNAPIVRTGSEGRELATAEHRCVVPFNSFSEFNKAEGGDIWFALDESRPLACFAGIWTNWTSSGSSREGQTTNVIYAFLTTEPNAEVGAIHPKAMPVILTTPDEVETWMTASPDQALKLQRPLPDGWLRIVARGVSGRPDQMFEEDGRPVQPWSALSAKAEADSTSEFDRYCCKSRKSSNPKNLTKVDIWTSPQVRRFSTPLRRS
jgi:putative SOS response-associated peptidase YedK